MEIHHKDLTMRYDERLGKFDLHILISSEEERMIEALRGSLPVRKQEQKMTRVMREALRFYYNAQMRESDNSKEQTKERGKC